MASSSQSNTIYDPIRKSWVAATPEEKVRQALIAKMVGELGYPPALIGVEKALSQLPHITSVDIPLRRLDIVVFGKDIHPEHSLYPLLVIECKAVKLTDEVVNQVAGYNDTIGAYYIGVANEHDVKTGWRTDDGYKFVPYLPAWNKISKI